MKMKITRIYDYVWKTNKIKSEPNSDGKCEIIFVGKFEKYFISFSEKHTNDEIRSNIPIST